MASGSSAAKRWQYEMGHTVVLSLECKEEDLNMYTAMLADHVRKLFPNARTCPAFIYAKEIKDARPGD